MRERLAHTRKHTHKTYLMFLMCHGQETFCLQSLFFNVPPCSVNHGGVAASSFAQEFCSLCRELKKRKKNWKEKNQEAGNACRYGDDQLEHG